MILIMRMVHLVIPVLIGQTLSLEAGNDYHLGFAEFDGGERTVFISTSSDPNDVASRVGLVPEQWFQDGAATFTIPDTVTGTLFIMSLSLIYENDSIEEASGQITVAPLGSGTGAPTNTGFAIAITFERRQPCGLSNMIRLLFMYLKHLAANRSW